MLRAFDKRQTTRLSSELSIAVPLRMASCGRSQIEREWSVSVALLSDLLGRTGRSGFDTGRPIFAPGSRGRRASGRRSALHLRTDGQAAPDRRLFDPGPL